MRLPKPLRYPLAIANDVRVESQHDNVVIVAAGVAFYAVLALLPALFVAVSLYGLFTDVGEAERQIDSLLDVFPGSAAMVLDTQMRAIAAASHANLSLGFLASTAALLWTVSNATRALVRSVKIAYDQETEKSVLEGRVIAIGITFGVLVAIVIALALVAAVPIWLRRFDPTHALVTFGNFRWLAIGAGMAVGIGLLYRYAPPRRPDGWRSVVPGVVFATVMWTIASIGFSVYVSSFSNYNETYGTLGAAVILLLWFWFTSLAVIMGAEVNEAFVLRPYDEQRAKSAPPQDPVPGQVDDTPVDPNPPSPRPDSSSASTSM
jgi:membrane protein